MGADLILSILAYPAADDFKLNWAAGDELIDATVTLPELEEWAGGLDEESRLEDCLDDNGDPDYAKVKDEIKTIFEKLKEDVIEDWGREVAAVRVRDLWVVISGGMSWGDSPTDACRWIDAANHFPTILTAIGFDVNWDEPLHAALDREDDRLTVEWQAAFDALKAAGLEADADDPIALRYREASNAVNHSHRKREARR